MEHELVMSIICSNGSYFILQYGFNIGNLFRGNLELRKLINWGGPYVEPGGEWFFMDHKDVVVFVDNHDTQRGGLGGAPISYKMKRQYQVIKNKNNNTVKYGAHLI